MPILVELVGLVDYLMVKMDLRVLLHPLVLILVDLEHSLLVVVEEQEELKEMEFLLLVVATVVPVLSSLLILHKYLKSS
jgi:hypothetical protein